MKKQFILNSNLNIKDIEPFFIFLAELHKKTELNIIFSSEGGTVSSAEMLAYFIKKSIEDGRIIELNIFIVEYCSSSAIDFIYSLRDKANIYLTNSVTSILHKLYYTNSGENPLSKEEIKYNNEEQRKDLSAMLHKYGKYLTKQQISSLKTGADVYLNKD